MISFILLVTAVLVIAAVILAVLSAIGIISIGCIALILDPLICILLLILIGKLIHCIFGRKKRS